MLLSFPHRLTRPLGMALAILGLLAFAPALKAGVVAKGLQGKYKVSSAVTYVNGQQQPKPDLPTSTYSIGTKGLGAVTGATLSKINSATGGGNGTRITVVSSTSTTLSATLAGTIGGHNNATIISGNLKSSLQTSGWTINFNIKANNHGQQATVSIVIILKKF